MKKLFLAISLIFSGLAAMHAQCTVDSAALNGTIPVYPPPETMDHPEWGINAPACAGQPFEFTITFAVPDTFVYNGVPVALNYVSIASSGAITSTPSLPAWVGYSCNPTTCKYLKNTLGCAKIFGNVPTTATLDSFDLQIAVKVGTSFIELPITAPSGLNIPGYYRLRTYPLGHPLCTSSTDGLASVIYKIEASPNPFSYLTTVNVEAVLQESVDFQVFNWSGQRVESRRIQLWPGQNPIEFDASGLPNGIYLYTIGNEKGVRSGKLAVNR